MINHIHPKTMSTDLDHSLQGVRDYFNRKINFYSYLRDHLHRLETESAKIVIQRQLDESHRIILHERIKAYKELSAFRISRWIPCLWYKAAEHDKQLRHVLYLSSKLENIATDLEIDMYETKE